MTSLAIIGAGPRSVLVLERLAAQAADLSGVTIHLVDPHPAGAGAVWRTDQPRDLCMNTLAAASTVFTDASYTGPGPVRPGPTFFEWASALREGTLERPAGFLDPETLRADFGDELAAMVAWSHPSRALFGHYLVWAHCRAVADLHRLGVEVVEHRTRAVGVDPLPSGGYRVRLAKADPLSVEAVVLALGWTHVQPNDRDAALSAQVATARVDVPEAAPVVWVGPDSPIDQDLGSIGAGEPVLVRGLGMGFFDLMSLLTIGRGGRFVHEGERLRYQPSGGEPVLHVGSDRGVPFLSKTRYGSLPPAPAMTHLRAALARLPRPLPVAELWPAILRDSLTEHARVLVRTTPEAVSAPETLLTDLAAVPEDAPLEAVECLVADRVDARHRFDPERWEFPAQGHTFNSPAEYDQFVTHLLRDDLTQANLGHDSALKAGLWAISTARKIVGDEASFDHVDGDGELELQRLLRWGAMLGSGPPAFRNEQLLALAEAGLVHFIGPHTRTLWTGAEFALESPVVPGSHVAARTLVDAWMPMPHPDRAADPLVAGLVAAGTMRSLRRPRADHPDLACASADVVEGTGELVGADGAAWEGLFMVGIGVDGARRDAIQAPIPGINSASLREAGVVAQRLLDLVTSRQHPHQRMSA